MRFADVQWPAPFSLHSMFKAHYKCQVIIIIRKTSTRVISPDDELLESIFLRYTAVPRLLLLLYDFVLFSGTQALESSIEAIGQEIRVGNDSQ